MANYLCRTVTELPGYMQVNFIVPEGTQVYAGEIYMGNQLEENTHFDNYTVFLPEVIENISKEIPAIILNGGFETLPDGRRPDGQPDYTQYTMKSGEVVTAHRLIPETRYEVSFDACDNTVVAGTVKPGDNLIPKNGQYELSYSAKATEVTAKNYLKIEAIKYSRLGGQFGGDFAQTMVVRAKATDATA